MIKNFIFEWVLHSGFEKACKVSRDTCFQPFIEKSLLETMKENMDKKMYL